MVNCVRKAVTGHLRALVLKDDARVNQWDRHRPTPVQCLQRENAHTIRILLHALCANGIVEKLIHEVGLVKCSLRVGIAPVTRPESGQVRIIFKWHAPVRLRVIVRAVCLVALGVLER